MGWVRVDDHFNEHPKLAQVGPLGWGFWLAGLAYCNRNLTDGFIPRSVAHSMASFELVDEDDQLVQLCVLQGVSGGDLDCEWVARMLVISGVWHEVSGGYRVHDYHDFQPTKEKVLAERGKSAQRQGKFRNAPRNGGSNGVTNGVTNAGDNGVTNGPVTGAPNPNPKPKENVNILSSLRAEEIEILERLCLRLADKIRGNDPKAHPQAKSHRWLNDMRLLLNDREGDVTEIERVIDWCQQDDFWRGNILSPGKLRKQFPQLLLKSEKPNLKVVGGVQRTSDMTRRNAERAEEARRRRWAEIEAQNAEDAS